MKYVFNFIKFHIINRIRSRWLNFPYLFLLKFKYLLKYEIKNHHLPNSLIVSLTSYPPRFNTIEKTLNCLIKQSVKPDKIILWISYSDHEILPRNILKIKEIEVRFYSDIKSYKKIIPTIENFENSFIVTADDDLYYEYNWLEKLVKEFKGNYKEVICHRAHKIKLDSNGLPLRYLDWDHPKKETSSNLIFPTNGAGTLFPPGIFNSLICRYDLIKNLCPTSDDIWLWWMVRLNNGTFRKIGNNYKTINTSNYNQIGLWYGNMVLGGNDKQMKLMISFFNKNQVFQ